MMINAKRKARARVYTEVRAGRLAHANTLPCIDCGHVWSEGDSSHEYDHPRGYEGDAALDVEPRCVPCHRRKDDPKAQQVACIYGHLFDEQNTGRKPDGTRFCKECHRIHDRTKRGRDAAFWRAYRRNRKAA